jgi:hypothetical protein
VLLGACSGCSLLLDSGAGGGTAGGDNDGGGPPLPGELCSDEAPFGVEKEIRVFESDQSEQGNHDNPTLSADESRLVYRHDQVGVGFFVAEARRNDNSPQCGGGICFTGAEPIDEVTLLGNYDNVDNPKLSSDGLVLRVALDEDNDGPYEVWEIEREKLDEGWQDRVPLQGYGENNTIWPPYPVAAVEVYAVDGELRSRDSQQQEFLSELTAFLVSAEAPWVSDDGLAIYFASGDDQDLFYSTRSATDQPWGDAEIVPGLNTGADEGEPWLSPNRCVMYFSRQGDFPTRIFRAQRSPGG